MIREAGGENRKAPGSLSESADRVAETHKRISESQESVSGTVDRISESQGSAEAAGAPGQRDGQGLKDRPRYSGNSSADMNSSNSESDFERRASMNILASSPTT